MQAASQPGKRGWHARFGTREKPRETGSNVYKKADSQHGRNTAERIAGARAKFQGRGRGNASPAPDQAQILKTTEAFVRNLFAWGTDFKVKLGPLTQSTASDYYLVPIEVTLNDHSDNGEVYVSKDGKTLFRGDMFDMAADPYASARAKMHIEGNPVKGPADARVTLVEFGDFECPNCRQLEPVLKDFFDQYKSKLRLVFKDFPLEQVHPVGKDGRDWRALRLPAVTRRFLEDARRDLHKPGFHYTRKCVGQAE
jgi:thiol-disulfide isomerase/thioredoxin